MQEELARLEAAGSGEHVGAGDADSVVVGKYVLANQRAAEVRIARMGPEVYRVTLLKDLSTHKLTVRINKAAVYIRAGGGWQSLEEWFIRKLGGGNPKRKSPASRRKKLPSIAGRSPSAVGRGGSPARPARASLRTKGNGGGNPSDGAAGNGVSRDTDSNSNGSGGGGGSGKKTARVADLASAGAEALTLETMAAAPTPPVSPPQPPPE
jgi:hypothetical protein